MFIIVKNFFIMGEVRLNTEKRIDSKNFKLKIGTTNKINPIVVYIEGRAFISPQEDKEDYSKDISEIKHNFKHAISTSLQNTKLFDKKFIVDFQVASKGVSLNKKSFLSFQFLLRQNKDNILKLKDLKPSAEPLIINIVNTLEESINNHNFIVTKTKTVK